MAQSLNITIQIKQVGENAFAELVKRIKAVNEALVVQNFAPFAELSQKAKEVSKELNGADQSVKGLQQNAGSEANVLVEKLNQVDNSLKKIQKSIVEGLQNIQTLQQNFINTIFATIDRANKQISGKVANLTKEAGLDFEKAIARVSVISIGGLFLGFSETVQTALAKILLLFEGFGGGVKGSLLLTMAALKSSYLELTALVESRILFISDLLIFVSDIAGEIGIRFIGISRAIFPGLVTLGDSLEKIAATTFSLLGGVGALFGVVTIFRLFSKETKQLFDRVIGLGSVNLSPLERLSRIISFVDISLNSVQFRFTQLGKTIFLFAAGIGIGGSSILTLLPGINSLLSNTINFLTRFVNRFLAGAGSARAQISLIFIDLKNIALTALPGIISIAENFSKLSKNATSAEKQIKRIGENEGLKALSNTKLPFATQFQIFIVEVRAFLTELISKINIATLSIQSGLGLSKGKIADISVIAKQSVQDVQSGIKEVTGKIEGFGKRGFFIRIFSGFTSFFKNSLFDIGKILNFATLGIPGRLLEAFKNRGNLGKPLEAFRGENFFDASLEKSKLIKKEFAEMDEKTKSILLQFEKIKQFFNSLPFTKQFNQEFTGFTGKLQTFGGTAAAKSPVQSDAVKQANGAIVELNKSLEGTKSQVSATLNEFDKLLKEVFELTKLSATKDQKGIFSLAKKDLSGGISGFVKAFGAASIGKGPLIDIDNSINKILVSIAALQKATNTFNPGKFEILSKAFSSFRTENLTAPDISLIKKSFSDLQQAAIGTEKVTEKSISRFADRIPGLLKNGFVKGDAGIKSAVDIFIASVSKIFSQPKNLEKAGTEIPKQLAAGMKAGQQELQKVSAGEAEAIMAYFPQSPAKAGALRNLVKAGSLIPVFIAQGMESAKSTVAKAAGNIAETIANFFPRSLPGIGALTGILKAGIQISGFIGKGMLAGIDLVVGPATVLAKAILFALLTGRAQSGYRSTGTLISRLISQGILDTIGFFQDVSDTIGKTIKETISKAANFGFIADRAGISVRNLSLLENALLSVGGKVEDVSFAFNKTNETLRQSFTPEEAAKLQKFGINLGEIRQAGDPILALFLKISDVIQRFGPNSLEAKEALELIGVTANSNLVNVFAKGSEEIKRLIAESANLGLIYDEAFVKASQKVQGFFNLFAKAKDVIKESFVAGILPEIEKSGNELKKFFEENSARIKGFATSAGGIFAQVFVVIKKFAILAITEPGKAFDVLVSIAANVFGFVSASFGQLFGVLKGKVFDFATQLGLFALNATIGLGKNLGDEIGRQAALIFIKITTIFSDFVNAVFPEGLTDVLNFVINFGSEVLLSVKNIFSFLLAEINLQVQKILLSILKTTGDFLVSNPNLSKILKTLGLSGFVESRETISKQYDAVLKQLEKSANRAGLKTTEDITNGVNSVGQAIDKFIGGLSEKYTDLLNDSESGSNKFIDSVKATLKTAQEDSVKLAESLKQAGASFTDPKQLETFKANLKKLGDDLQKTLKVGLNFEFNSPEFKKQLEEVTTQIKKTFGEVNTLQEQAAKSDEKTAKAIADKKAQILFDTQIAAAKTEDERRALQNQKELFELKNRQALELQQFEELLNLEHDKELSFEQDQVNDKLQLDQFRADQQQAIQNKEAEATRENLLNTFSVLGSAASTAGQLFNDLFELSGKKSKEFFFISKGIAIAEAVINVAQAVTKALAQGGFLGIAQAALVSAAGVAQIAKITATGFASGGPVSGGSGTRDDVPAMLTAGEFVQPRHTVQHYGANLMEALRRHSIPKDALQNLMSNMPDISPKIPASLKFADGGVIPRATFAQPAPQQQQTPINIVNVMDQTQFDRYLASGRGTKSLINIISDNSSQFRSALQV